MVFGIVLVGLFLLFGCTAPPIDSNLDVQQPVVGEDNSNVVEEVFDEVVEELVPSNIGETGIIYNFNSIECTATPDRLKCESCLLDKNMKVSTIYVDYTNKTDHVQGYVLKMNYGVDNNLSSGTPLSLSVGQTKRLTVSSNPLTLDGCLINAKVELYTYPTFNLVESLTVESNE